MMARVLMRGCAYQREKPMAKVSRRI
jgi:hypothetical protein